MKFKFDENLPIECALIFREAGFELIQYMKKV